MKSYSKEQKKLIRQIKDRLEYYQKRYAGFLDQSKEAFEFYRGKQWSYEDEMLLKSKGKPPLVKNRIAPRVELMTGYQRQNRYYFKVIPSDLVEEEEKLEIEELAKQYTAKLKEIEGENDGEYELTDCFKEGTICGDSTLEAFPEVDKSSIIPKIKIMFRQRCHDEVITDPDDLTYDLSRSTDLFKFTKMSRAALKEMFPNQVDLIDILNDSESIQKDDGVERKDYPSFEHGNSKDDSKSEQDIVLKEYWYFKSHKRMILLSNTLKEPVDITDKNHNEILQAYRKRQEIDNTIVFDIREVVRKTLSVAFYCGGHLLEERDGNIDELPFVKYRPNIVKSFNDIEMRYCGIVKQMIRPQEELNKRDSQLLFHLNSSVGSGWEYEESSLTPSQKEKLHKWGSAPGFMMEVRDGALQQGRIRRIEPANISQGHLILTERWEEEFNKLTNINPDLMGGQADTKSGRAIALRIQQGIMGIHTYFDSFRRTKHLLCRKLLKYLCYIDGVDYSKLKLVIDDAIHSPTARYANLEEMKALFELGVFDPNNMFADIILDQSNLMNKEEIKQRINKIQDFEKKSQELQEKEQILMQRESQLQQIEERFAAREAAMQDFSSGAV